MHQIFNMPFVSKNFITLLHSCFLAAESPFVQLFFLAFC